MDKNKIKKTPLAGSNKLPLKGAREIGPADSRERIMVTVMVRRNPLSVDLKTKIQDLSDNPETNHLSHDEFNAAHGADPMDLLKVEDFAQSHGLDIVKSSVAKRQIVLSGTTQDFGTAFGVDLKEYEHPSGKYRGRTGEIHIPVELQGIVEGVFGLDNRPQARPYLRLSAAGNNQLQTQGVSYTPPQVARLYDFPTGYKGNGQSIAIIELGGGYRISDLINYFARLGIPFPRLKTVPVDRAYNRPTGDPNGPDGEVVLDIEVAGSVAPGAGLVVYFAPNTDAGFLDAITAAIHDRVNKPSVISISWGAAEADWTAQAMQAMEHAFMDAAVLGITVCCASGDNGSSDGVDDGLLHVDFPASSPHVLGCGGTRLIGSGSKITSEVVWNDGPQGGATGGGVSRAFGLPAWQGNSNVPPVPTSKMAKGRGVPDVAGNADPYSGYQVLVDRQQFVVGGTSAVAPLWAALIAIINQRIGRRMGFVNPLLYKLPNTTGAFHDITVGSNDTVGNGSTYPAKPGWDACTGLGSPDGNRLMNAILANRKKD